METLTRTQFLISANLVWLAQFVAEFLVTLTPDAIAWHQRAATNLQVGCVGDTANYVPYDRLYLLALAWILTTPLMTVAALRYPALWPERMPHPLWNRAAPGVSLVTLAPVLALLAWPINAGFTVPVTSVILVEAARALPLLAVTLYYRGVLLAR